MDSQAERLARGEQAAFAELYDGCADRLHHYLVARLGSRHDADDVLQETFVRLARTRKRVSGVDNMVAYVFTIARQWNFYVLPIPLNITRWSRANRICFMQQLREKLRGVGKN